MRYRNVALIKINKNTFETTYERFNDDLEIYRDREIIVCEDNIGIICISDDDKKVYYYERLLLRELISETSKEINNAYDEVCRLNKRYIGLVNKLIGEEQ